MTERSSRAMLSPFGEMLRSHPDALDSRPRFSGLLMEYFPRERVTANLLRQLYDMGIHKEIKSAGSATGYLVHRYVSRLISEYGTDRKLAENAVALFCACYGGILGKPYDQRSSHLGGTPAPQQSPTKSLPNYFEAKEKIITVLLDQGEGGLSIFEVQCELGLEKHDGAPELIHKIFTELEQAGRVEKQQYAWGSRYILKRITAAAAQQPDAFQAETEIGDAQSPQDAQDYAQGDAQAYETENPFQAMLRNHPDALDSNARFSGLLTEYFQEQQARAALLRLLYDMGIHKDIGLTDSDTGYYVQRYVSQLVEKYRIERRRVEDAADLFCSGEVYIKDYYNRLPSGKPYDQEEAKKKIIELFQDRGGLSISEAQIALNHNGHYCAPEQIRSIFEELVLNSKIKKQVYHGNPSHYLGDARYILMPANAASAQQPTSLPRKTETIPPPNYLDIRRKIIDLLRDRGTLSISEVQSALNPNDYYGALGRIDIIFANLEIAGLVEKQGDGADARYVFKETTDAPLQQPTVFREAETRPLPDYWDAKEKIMALLLNRGWLSVFEAQIALGLKGRNDAKELICKVFTNLEIAGLVEKQGNGEDARYVFKETADALAQQPAAVQAETILGDAQEKTGEPSDTQGETEELGGARYDQGELLI